MPETVETPGKDEGRNQALSRPGNWKLLVSGNEQLNTAWRVVITAFIHNSASIELRRCGE